jgi:hypothetical protein
MNFFGGGDWNREESACSACWVGACGEWAGGTWRIGPAEKCSFAAARSSFVNVLPDATRAPRACRCRPRPPGRPGAGPRPHRLGQGRAGGGAVAATRGGHGCPPSGGQEAPGVYAVRAGPRSPRSGPRGRHAQPFRGRHGRSHAPPTAPAQSSERGPWAARTRPFRRCPGSTRGAFAEVEGCRRRPLRAARAGVRPQAAPLAPFACLLPFPGLRAPFMLARMCPAEPCGDCFVVLSAEGLYWTGSEWVPDWQRGQQFADPVDPFSPCEALAAELRAGGIACNPAYVPAAKVYVAKAPNRRSGRQTGGQGDLEVMVSAAVQPELHV